MESSIIGMFLPPALAIVMLGLGLTLTLQDFARVAKAPKAAVIALVCQMIVLPAICFGVVLMFDLEPVLAVGMMLLAASPGGSTANLFSHLAGGDVALNISLTAINSVLAVVTVPIITGLSMNAFLGDAEAIGMQPGKIVQVFAMVLVPVVVGMWIRARYTSFAERMRRPVKIASVVALVLVLTAAAGQDIGTLLGFVAELGLAALLLIVLSLTIGYFVPRAFGVGRKQAIASSMEVGIHNAMIAIAMAISVLGNPDMAIPAAVYGFLMFGPAAIAALIFARTARPAQSAQLATATAG